MHDEGLPLDRVLDALREARRRDFSYADGEILGSMCTAPDAAALEALKLFYETNLGDPGHFPGTRALEGEYLTWLVALAHGGPHARGLLTSGGTESNLLAVYAARDAWRAAHPDDARRANIVVPEGAHFSFEKARRITDVEIRYAAVDARHRVRPAAVDALVDDATCLIVGIAGTTEVGALDPIAELSALAVRRYVPLHVDAALGGFMLPFLARAGRAPFAWDFALDGVSSITMDPHKMGASLIPGGLLLTREASWLDRIAVETPYVTTKTQSGILGTRPGVGAAAAWASARHLGRAGYARITREKLELTRWLREQIEAEGHTTIPGDLNVILVRCSDPVKVQAELDARGWRVNAVARLGGIRLVMMPHVERAHVERFLPDLFAVLADHRLVLKERTT